MQAELIISDPYANAYYAPPESKLPHPKNPWSKSDITTPIPSSATWENKWELDSLVSFLKLSHNYWSNTKDDRFLTNKIWLEAVNSILDILEIQQLCTMQVFKNEAYKFSRLTRTTTETLMMEGIGAPVKRIGLIKSQFRPSDDKKFQGVGSPHTGLGYIWPISLCMKILTSTNDQEILELLELLKESSADTGLMHESFYYNDPNNYTRSWFT
ncbi:Glycoside Hydrolase Family 125 protein [Rhizophagus diaphanus]|nr:Glycoside Hydrolase Family 125 protein [Rhizophagus diaphanus] [Rhizophagus sp. MUCL 43196]